MIEIKDPEVLDGLYKRRYHVTLRRLMRWVIIHFPTVTIVITKSYAPKTHPDDLHGTIPVRADDVRAWVFSDAQKAADEINEAWEYDCKRPEMLCCVYHARCPKCGHDNRPPYHEHCERCGTTIILQWHFHIQVHSRTRMRG